MKTKVRFAPSPTGYLHIGGLRTALFNYLYAQKVAGKFILRIEDTDQNRKIDSAINNLFYAFNHLNIHFDEGPNIGGKNGPYIQSKRLSIYQKHINILLEKKLVYHCFCKSDRLSELRNKLKFNKKIIKYDRHCLSLSKEEIKNRMLSEKYTIRMKVPNIKEVIFNDIIREKISFNCSELDDSVLIKSDGYPTYHFANVIDDHLMQITHVIRGEEWLSSTPKHVLLYNFFEWKLPKFIHLPLILNPDKSKLSKRTGDVAVDEYIKKGYLPEAIINFVSLLGWNPKSEREIFSLKELENEFSINYLNKTGAVFDINKLNWMNSQYLKNTPLKIVTEYAKPYFIDAGFDISDLSKFDFVIENARKRSNTILEMIECSKAFYNPIIINNNNIKMLQTDSSQKILIFFTNKLSNKYNWSINDIKLLINETIKITGIKGKDLYFPLRLSLLGSLDGPDIPILIEILGVKESINRIKKHIQSNNIKY